MSETPYTRMFDVQRTMIQRSNQAFKQSLAMQREAFEAFRSTFETQKSTQRRSVEATQRAVDAYFEAIEDATAGAGAGETGVSELQEIVDEQFAALLDLHDQSWEAFEQLAEENAAAYDEYVARLETMADDSTGAALGATGRAREETEIVVESTEDASDR